MQDDLALLCMGAPGSAMTKREAGFRKTSQVRFERGGNAQEHQIDMQFCNSCDTLIMFDECSFYTCGGKCDFFICLTCAECPNSHPFQLASERPSTVIGAVNCSKCHNQVFSSALA